jgi:hypothetical protein
MPPSPRWSKHTSKEPGRAARLIGVNARNPKTPEVDRSAFKHWPGTSLRTPGMFNQPHVGATESRIPHS